MTKAAPKTAVILAAGMGSRLKDRSKNLPKGLLNLGGMSLVARSIQSLKSCGIQKIILGTGFLSEVYEATFGSDSTISFIENEKFATSGSLFTLYQLKESLHEDIVLLESDILYENRGLEKLLVSPYADAILASGATQSGDEVYIETKADGGLFKMSKRKEELAHIDGELVGITKISKDSLRDLFIWAQTEFDRDHLKIEYETGLIKLAESRHIHIEKMNDLAWCEIDDESHWQRANEKILPRILSSNISQSA